MAFTKYSEGHQGSCSRSARVNKIFREKPTKPWVKGKDNLPGSPVVMAREADVHAPKGCGFPNKAPGRDVKCSGHCESRSSPISTPKFLKCRYTFLICKTETWLHLSTKQRRNCLRRKEECLCPPVDVNTETHLWNILESAPNLPSTKVSTHRTSPQWDPAQNTLTPCVCFEKVLLEKSILYADIFTITII